MAKGLYGFVLLGRYHLMEIDCEVDMMFDVMCSEVSNIMKSHHGNVLDIFITVKAINDNICWPTTHDKQKLWHWTDHKIRDKKIYPTWKSLLHNNQMSLIHVMETQKILQYEGGEKLMFPNEEQRSKYELMCWWNMDADVISLHDCNGLLVTSKTVTDVCCELPARVACSIIIDNFYNLSLLFDELIKTKSYKNSRWSSASVKTWLYRQLLVDLELIRDD